MADHIIIFIQDIADPLGLPGWIQEITELRQINITDNRAPFG